MSGDDNVFKRTGKNVSVPKDELITVGINKLMYYDSLTPRQRKNKKCPYTEPMITKLNGGKTIQIPENIQKIAITEWQTMKSKAGDDSKYSEAHTRLGRRDRYSGQDPYVMNPEITGQRSLTVGNEVDSDYSTDNELSRLQSHERRSRGHVGETRVPDQRYGSGGSFGDLPRDYEIFGKRMADGMDDYPDQHNVNERNGLNSLKVQRVREVEDNHNQLHAGDALEENDIAENCAPIEHMEELDMGVYEDAGSCKSCGDDSFDYDHDIRGT